MRIASISETEATGKVAGVYELLRRAFGRVTPAFQAMSLEPDYLDAFWSLHQVVMAEGELSRREKEAIAVAVSAANGCEYCVAAHSGRLRALGADETTIEGLKTTPEAVAKGTRERAVLRLALRVTRSPTSVGDADIEDLRREGLSDRAILEAVAVTAHFNGLNRFLDALGVRPPRPR